MQWDYRDQQAAKAREAVAAAKAGTGPKPKDTGFLSLHRVSNLDDMSVDLSEQLRAPLKPLLPPSVPGIAMTGTKRGESTKRYSDPATPHQEHRWERSRNYVRRGSTIAAQADNERFAATGTDAAAAAADARAAEIARFEQLRKEYNLWTTGTVAVCFALVYTNYTKVRLWDALLVCPWSLSVCGFLSCFASRFMCAGVVPATAAAIKQIRRIGRSGTCTYSKSDHAVFA
jgi:hypothetical protein